MSLRNQLKETLQRVASQERLRHYTPDTLYKPGRCAQQVREFQEDALNLPENSWPVAVKAHEFRKRRNWPDRWAVDYEKAGIALGLKKPFSDVEVGDVLYWPYTSADGNDYGHTAIYAGFWDGKHWILENTDANIARWRAKGAVQLFGSRARVWLTPMNLHGQPRTVIAPAPALLMKPAPPAAKVEDIPALPQGNVGRVWEPVYDDDTEQLIPGLWVSLRRNRKTGEGRIFRVSKKKLDAKGLK